jgi:hypothetical protein
VKRFLVVGCGGSGGATLQFLMDQLRADLGRRGLGLPRGWQFLHVDVPTSPDGVAPGLPPTVPQQGGRYVPLAHQGATYKGVAHNVESRLQDAGQLAELATYRPDPEQVTFSITDGAGQYRSVGRTLTLSQVRTVTDQLHAAWAALQSETAISELRAVAAEFSPRTEAKVRDRPVVLVVSSMAGGAGASMVLDVCRLLTGLDRYDPLGTGLFLFTPQVFAELPPTKRRGVDGNAMAMMGELLAAQAGAGAAGDVAVLRAMGLSAREVRLPFGRVFPIGSRIGTTGAEFGDGSMAGIYRGLGRGLAALMLSGEAAHDFVAYDLTNPLPPATDARQFGWGSNDGGWHWMSFGFASLGLGRERYGEYAAQRLARLTVDRLVEGHLQPADTRPATEQLSALADARWQGFLADAGLPAPGQPMVEWLRPLVERSLSERLDLTLRETVDGPLADGHGSHLDVWLPTALSQIATLRRPLHETVRKSTYRWAFAWHQQLRGAIESALMRTVQASGLALGREMLRRTQAACGTWVAALQAEAARAPQDVAARPAEVETLPRGGKGRVTVGPEVVERVRSGYRRQVWGGMLGTSAGYAADVIASFARDLLEPLVTATDDALGGLLDARLAPVQDAGLARVETEEYAAWPEAGRLVPRRFAHAHNEVLLTAADDFPGLFDGHLQATFDGLPVDTARSHAVSQVLSGRWETTGRKVDLVVLECLVPWRPGVLGADPDDESAVNSPMVRAQYRLAVRPEEVLSRARRWVTTEKQPFDAFVRQSLRDHLNGADVQQGERDRRAKELRARFREVLTAASPLVDVNEGTVSAQHPAAGVQRMFKFSPLPFAGHQLGLDLADDLAGIPDVDPTTVTRFTGALDVASRATRVDVFGSYSHLSPVCFASLLAPLETHWASCTDHDSRQKFFDRRRARRLAGGLPMGDAQRRAIIGGWYVARVTGRLRLPGEHHGSAVQVWDPEAGAWVSFPSPLLVEESQFVTPSDVLPSVLLSSLLALAQSHSSPYLEPFRPYTVLRRTWDDGHTPRHADAPLVGLAAAAVLRRHLVEGDRPLGAPARTQEAEALWSQQRPEERRDALADSLTDLREYLGMTYLPPGPDNSGGGAYSVLSHREQLNRVPLFHEVAPDVHVVLGWLVDLLRDLPLAVAVPPPLDPSAPRFDKALG